MKLLYGLNDRSRKFCLKVRIVSPLYWKSGIIRMVCTTPKVPETRALLKLVDDMYIQAVDMKDLDKKLRIAVKEAIEYGCT